MESLLKENEESPFLKSISDDPELQIYAFIIGPKGEYIVHPDRTRILKTNFYDYATGEDAARYRKLGDAMTAGESGEESVWIDGIRTDVYFAPLLHSGWSMGVVVPVKRLLLPGILYGTMIIVLILVGVFLVFITCHRSIKRASTPLIKLAESAQEIATGRFDTQLPTIKSKDEIRLLRDSFDHMQTSLARYVEELKVTTAQNASIESELGVARNIQMSMLPFTWPPFPDRNDLDIFGSVAPARAVGGDLFDFRIRDEKLFFCIGDVSGKGVPAALVMTVIGSMFQTLSASEDNPLRIMADWSYSLQEMTLTPGTILFLYTDGLTEATRSDGELFQEERVQTQLSGHDENTTAECLVADMTAAVDRFIGDAEQSDDLTMLVLKWRGNRTQVAAEP